MEKSTAIKLLLLAGGMGFILYLINASRASGKVTNVKPVNTTSSTASATPTVPESTPNAMQSTAPVSTATTAQLQRNADQVKAAVVIDPTIKQLTLAQAQAALAEAKRIAPWLNFDKTLSYLYKNAEVSELQRLMEVAQITGIFREQERDKLKVIKGVEWITLSDWYLTPNLIDFNIIK